VTELQVGDREMRDRMARLEVKVEHLPSKGFIVVVVTSALVIFGAVITIAPHLQGFFTPPSQHVLSAPNQTPAK
jgi:hypothetical protein